MGLWNGKWSCPSPFVRPRHLSIETSLQVLDVLLCDSIFGLSVKLLQNFIPLKFNPEHETYCLSKFKYSIFKLKAFFHQITKVAKWPHGWSEQEGCLWLSRTHIPERENIKHRQSLLGLVALKHHMTNLLNVDAVIVYIYAFCSFLSFFFFSFLFWYFGSSAYLFHHCLSCFQSFVLSLHLSFNWRGKALLSCVSEDLAEPEWGGSSLSVSPLRWAGFLHRTGIKNDFQLSSHLVHWKDTKTTFGVTNWMLMVSISLSILYKAC